MWGLMAWQLLWLISLVGYGSILRRTLRINSPANPLGVELLLGMFLVAGIGGVLMYAGVAGPAVWVAVVALGGVVSAWRLARTLTPFAGVQRDRRHALGVAGVGLGSFMVMTVAFGQVVTRRWTACDDDPAYLYLATRIWGIGDIDDPFNNRRLVSSGLGSLLQSLSMGPIGENALHALDQITGAALLLTLALAASRHRERLVLVAMTLGLVALDNGFGQSNSSPTLLLAGLMAVALNEVYHATRRPATSFAPSMQIVVLASALLVLMRPFAGFALGLFGFWLLVTVPEVRTAFTRRFVSVQVLLVAPWLVMSMRDVSTPLFPVLTGVSNSEFPLAGRAGRVGVADTLRVAATDLLLSRNGLFLIACTALIVLLRVDKPAQRWSHRVGVLYGASTAAFLLYFATLAIVSRRTGVPDEYPRFWVPVLFAGGIAVVAFGVTEAEKSPVALRRLNLTAPFAALGAVMLVLTVNQFAISRESVAKVFNGEMATILASDRYASVRDQYEAVKASIKPGQTALTAVDLPHLLLDDEHRIVTLDIAGANAPRGPFPFSGTFQERVDWTKDQDIDLLIVYVSGVDATDSCLFSREEWLPHKGSASLAGDWEPYAVGWIDFAEELTTKVEPVSQFGRLAVIDVRSLR